MNILLEVMWLSVTTVMAFMLTVYGFLYIFEAAYVMGTTSLFLAVVFIAESVKTVQGMKS